MIYLAYISIGFLMLQFINVFINFVFRQRIKTTFQSQTSEKISILIPARNEEHHIGNLLTDLLEYKNPDLEIIVFNDESVDDTVSIVMKFAKKDDRVKLIHSEGLPEGWLGKNYACYQLTNHAGGDFLLFLDADVRINSSLIDDAIIYMKKYKLSLLTIFPVQTMITLGEKLTVPLMNYILLTLLPLIFVRISPFKSHAAANGQFMLFNAAKYREIQPHKIFKNTAIEDITIARFFKKQKLKVACITGEKRVKCRMYQSYTEAVNGFSKNVFMFFGNIPILAFIFWFFTAPGFIPVMISLPQYLVVYFFTLMLTLMLYSFVSKQNIINNILLFPLQQICLIHILIKAFFARKNKNLVWKQRNIYIS